MTATERHLRMIEAELDAASESPTSEQMARAGAIARDLEMQGYTPAAAWAKARLHLED